MMPVKQLRALGLIAIQVALATLVANGWLLNRTARNIQEAFGDADRVRGLLALNEHVLDFMRDAETGQRGFILTGREDDLDPYHAAEQALPGDMKRLALGFAGDAGQSRRVGELDVLVSEKLEELKQTIALRRTGGLDAAVAVVLGGQGRRTMDRIREVSRAIETAETTHLAATLNARFRYANEIRLFVMLGSALLMLLVAGAFAALRTGDTQRQKLNTELVRAKDSLQTTLYSIGDAVIVTDTEGAVTLMNRVACSLTGWDEASARGRPLREVFHIVNEYTGAEVENPVARVVREGVIAGLANHTILVARDGRQIPIDDSAAPVRQEGQVVGAVLVFRDITARREAEKNAAYLAAIVENSGDAIIGKSLEGIIQSWNKGAEQVFGYRAEEIIGHSINELIPEDRRHEESAILERLRAGERVDHFETVRVRKDGTQVDVSLTISPIRDREGRIIGASKMARDISEQRRNAAAMQETQKLESLGVLAGGIAHDFNNLLTGILGNASLALSELEPGSPLKERMRDVIDASEKAAALTRQMLAYSGKGRFFVERINLTAQIREVVPLIKASVPSTVELRFDLDDQLPAIEADSAQMQQLIMNVIINGAEAIPEGRPGTVTITTHRWEVDLRYIRTHQACRGGTLRPGQYVVFKVADTGSGMDKATIDRIFDPFFTTKFTGRGLGLAAVLGIVRGNDGCIQVASAPGDGTVFRVLFPVTELPPGPEPPGEEKKTGDMAACGTILVVDDEKVVRNTAQQSLERYGCEVLLAENGALGLETFRRESNRIRCVVLDMTMPVMSGEETLARMKSMRADIPVILSSGYSEAEATQRFAGKGLAGFLQKPYKAEDLARIVKGVLNQVEQA
jgi:PAS domain S-box-containing protein